MTGQRTPPPRRHASKGKSPAERADEFAAAQRQLKQEAAERREAAGASSPKPRKRRA